MKKEIKKKSGEKSTILGQCPECKKILVDVPGQERPVVIYAIVTFTNSIIKKVLCQKCVDKFQI